MYCYLLRIELIELYWYDFPRSLIIAISGFNMVLLAQAIMLILKTLLPRQPMLAALIGISAIILYTLFVGAGGAVIRAALMSSLLILGQAMRRKTYVPTSIALAVLLLSLYDPWFLWDVGFQLSVAAVIGMALFVPPLEKYFTAGIERLTDQKNARRVVKLLSDSLIVTLAAQITTTPLIVYYFGRLSLVSLPANFLIIPVQPLVLLFGAVGLLIALVFPLVGNVLLQIAELFLRWTVAIVRTFADFKWADMELHISQSVVLLIVLGLLIWTLYRATRPHWAAHLAKSVPIPGYAAYGGVLIALLMLIEGWAARPDGVLYVTFLDVAQSDAVLVQSPQGGIILINGGEFPTRLLEALPAPKIDVLVITSMQDADITALPEVLDRYPVGALLTTEIGNRTPLYDQLIRQVEAKSIPVVFAPFSYQITTDDQVQLELISGDVIRLTYGEAVFLLTGEITAAEEEILLQNPHLIQANVLQVPAHGSDDANSAAFLNVVQPQIAVIQLDPGRGALSPTVLSRLDHTHLYRTDQHGAITISSDGNFLWVATETSPDAR